MSLSDHNAKRVVVGGQRPGGQSTSCGLWAVCGDPYSVDGKEEQSCEQYGDPGSQVMPHAEGCVKAGVVKGDQDEDRVVAVLREGPVVVVEPGDGESV